LSHLIYMYPLAYIPSKHYRWLLLHFRWYSRKS